MRKLTDLLNQDKKKTQIKNQKEIRGLKTSISKEDLIVFVNELFENFELAYHFNFSKVYDSQNKIDLAKRLWAKTLKNFNKFQLQMAMKDVFLNNEYLPTLNEFVKLSSQQALSEEIPSVLHAFDEARKSYDPHVSFKWTHPIIYFAGKKVGWNNFHDQQKTLVMHKFRNYYLEYAEQAMNGKTFKLPHIETKPKERHFIDRETFLKLKEKLNL